MHIERSSEPILFFSKKEREKIVKAIGEAELKTSGEIRVHLERKAKQDIFEDAKVAFEKLGMTQTQARNGVLIFLGVKSKRFAILGDRGIHEKVPENFWHDVAKEMAEHFKRDEFAEGVIHAIRLIGEKLKNDFPYQRFDINELPDEISFSA